MTSAALLETNTMTINDIFPASEQIRTDTWYPSETFLANLSDKASELTWEEQSHDRALVRTAATAASPR